MANTLYIDLIREDELRRRLATHALMKRLEERRKAGETIQITIKVNLPWQYENRNIKPA